MYGSTDRDYATIGEVVQELRREFPTLSVSKIRYLEDEGLISPKRTNGGYRKFSQKDIERIRTILQLQREKFLPLNVIRANLNTYAKSGALKKEHFEGSKTLLKEEAFCSLSPNPDPLRKTINPDRSKPVVNESSSGPQDAVKTDAVASFDPSILKLEKKLEGYGLEMRHIRYLENAIERELSFYQQIFPHTLTQKGDKARKKALNDLINFIELTQELKNIFLRKSVNSFYGIDLLPKDAEDQKPL